MEYITIYGHSGTKFFLYKDDNMFTTDAARYFAVADSKSFCGNRPLLHIEVKM
jgi:hypothetical protein